MNVLLLMIAGVVLGTVQSVLFAEAPWAPDLRVVVLALVVARGPRHIVAARTVGLLLGLAAGSLEPLGSWLLGGGLIGFVMLSLRDLLFVERRGAQLVVTAVAYLLLELADQIAGALGRSPVQALASADLIRPLMTVGCAPILHALAEALDRLLPRDLLLARAPGEALSRERMFDAESTEER